MLYLLEKVTKKTAMKIMNIKMFLLHCNYTARCYNRVSSAELNYILRRML
jgi:hypothetical protein